jgi:hypothetical protein
VCLEDFNVSSRRTYEKTNAVATESMEKGKISWLKFKQPFQVAVKEIEIFT